MGRESSPSGRWTARGIAVLASVGAAWWLVALLGPHPLELAVAAVGVVLFVIGLLRGPMAAPGVEQMWWHVLLLGFCLVAAMLVHLECTWLCALLTVGLMIGCAVPWAWVIHTRPDQGTTDASSSSS